MFDLQLDNIKTGTMVCIIKPDGTTSNVYRVGDYSELHGKYRYESVDTGKHLGLIPNDGMGYYAMHPKDKPHFFFSANPLHITQAYKAIEAAEKKEQDKAEKDKKALKELQEKINALLSEYGASLDVSLNGDTHGVEAELYLSIGHQSIMFG